MTDDQEPLPTSARKLLVDWANQQDGWVRRLAGEVLLTRQPVTAAVLDETYEAYLIEKGLGDGDAADQPKIVLDETVSTGAAGFTIDKAVEGVKRWRRTKASPSTPASLPCSVRTEPARPAMPRVLKQLAS